MHLPSECPTYLTGGWGRNEPAYSSTGTVSQLDLLDNSLSASCTTAFPEIVDCFSGYLVTSTGDLATLASTSTSQSGCPVGNLTVTGKISVITPHEGAALRYPILVH